MNCQIPQPIYSKGDYAGLNYFIESSDLSIFYNSNDIDHQWTFLKTLIQWPIYTKVQAKIL